MIIEYNNKFTKNINNMAAPRIPNSEEYWKDKGKNGKQVWIYTHDDMDGVFSGIAIKKYLLSKGFEIKGYGIVNYQESWKATIIDKKFINVAVDFADFHPDIDIYIDHHGDFKESDDIRNQSAIKTKTGSAYEGIMDQLGLPVDSLVLSIIDMIDSAKYDQYGVKWTELLDYNVTEILQKPKAKLLFSGVFNQMIKRGDHRTLIEVIHNATDSSVYQILSLFKAFYPANNKDWRSGEEQDFFNDGLNRLDQVKKRSRGSLEHKDIITTQEQFIEAFTEEVPIYTYLINPETRKKTRRKKQVVDQATGEMVDEVRYEEYIKMNGYCVIGDMVFMPTGTWSNPIRSRAIVQQDIESGLLNARIEDIKWVFLIYGDTLQIVSFGRIDQTHEISSLKDYTDELLIHFEEQYDYKGSEDTTSGGHVGIGTISNIGTTEFCVLNDKYDDKELVSLRFLDIFKNKIISDLSGIDWKLNFEWTRNPKRYDQKFVSIPKNARMMNINQIRIVDTKTSMEITYPDNYEQKETIKELQKIAAIEKAEKEAKKQEFIDNRIEIVKQKHIDFLESKESGEDKTKSEQEK